MGKGTVRTRARTRIRKSPLSSGGENVLHARDEHACYGPDTIKERSFWHEAR